jgi:hypothetical protein
VHLLAGALGLDQLEDSSRIHSDSAPVAEHLLRRSVVGHPLDHVLEVDPVTASGDASGDQRKAGRRPIQAIDASTGSLRLSATTHGA